jgi:endo-1,4-beta-xylanase
MSLDYPVARRSVLLGAAGMAGAAATGLLTREAAVGATSPAAAAGHSAMRGDEHDHALWRTAWRNGIVFGASISTWQLDPQYRHLFRQQAALLSLQDDLLWYRLKKNKKAPLNYHYGDRMVNLAERNGMLVLGAPGLVWDDGFGNGWGPNYSYSEIWGLKHHEAKKLLYGIVRRTVHRYRGRIAAWIVANEVTDPDNGTKHGERTDVPWYHTIGPGYVHEAYHIAHEEDPHAELLINESGLETINKYGDKADARQAALLKFIDKIMRNGAPLHGVGIESHLLAPHFAERFHSRHFLKFLKEIADRGLKVHITELDVQDDGLPPNPRIRDRGVADVYRRYLDTVLQEPALKIVNTFGLSDRYTQLTQDFPRADGLPRRALPFNRRMEAKPAFYALSHALKNAPYRHPDFVPPRAR